MPQPDGIKWVGTGATATGTVSLSIAEPAGVVADDIVNVFFTHRGAGFATVPVGWNLVDRDIDGQGVRGEWYWFRSAGAGGPYSITGLADSAVGYISVLRGCETTGSPVNVQGKRVNASGANGAAAITTTVADAVVIMFNSSRASFSGGTFGVRHGASAPDSAYSMDPELSAVGTFGNVANTAGNDVAMAVCRGFKAVPGSTIDEFRIRTWSNGPADNLCIVAAFIPETGGATSGTRYYMPSCIPVSPRREPWGFEGDWGIGWIDGPVNKHVACTAMLSQQRSNDGFYNHITNDGDQLATNQQGNFDIVYRRFITPPLQAQTLAGTFQCTLGFNARWKAASGVLSNDSIARLKIHAYVTVGQTMAVRSVIPSLDNFVDAANINNANNNVVWTGLSAPASLAGVVIQEGDSIAFEIGTRIVSSPTPTPTYPPTSWTRVQIMAVGTGSLLLAAADDGVIGATATIPQVQLAHLDFTDTILEQSWVPASPTNISPSTATDIVETPFSQVDAPYNTHGSTANSRSVWYKHTATRTGTLIVMARGTWGFVSIDVFTGGPAYSTLVGYSPVGAVRLGDHSLMRCTTFARVPVESGTTYYFQVIGNPEPGFAGLASVLSLSAAYQEAPASGDKFLPNQWVYVFRGHHVVNLNYLLDSYSPTGIAIDYTRRELDAFPTPNTNYRMYINLYGSPVVEIFDLTDVNEEVDYIFSPLLLASGRETAHLAALHMTKAGGFLYIQTFGNGFLSATGFELGIPAYQSSLPNFDDLGYVRGLDGAHAENQPGAPWPIAAEYAANMEGTGPWHGGLNQTTGVLFYSCSGSAFTLPGVFPTTPGNTQIAQRFNVFNDTQGADLATLPAIGASIQGPQGMCVNAAGEVFVTNGSQMVLFNGESGAVIRTYTPISEYPVSLMDAQLDPDGVHVWTYDHNAGDFFQFNIATGSQTDRIRVWGGVRAAIQFAIFTPDEIPVPVPPAETEIRYIRRIRQAPHLSDEQRMIRYNRFWLDLQAGVGTTEGQGLQPVVYLSWSDDGGHRWSNEYPMYAGLLGRYKHRAMRRRLGSSRDRVFRVSMSDPVDWVLLDAYIDISPGTT